MGKLSEIDCDFCKRGKCSCIVAAKAYCSRCWISKLKIDGNKSALQKLKKKEVFRYGM